MNITKIAIVTHDNDFTSTYRGVLETLKYAFYYKGKLSFTKQQLCEIINDITLSNYKLSQNQYEYTNGKTFEEHYKHIKKYLTREEKDILLNEEVDKYLEENDWNNSETFILDLTVKNYDEVSPDGYIWSH